LCRNSGSPPNSLILVVARPLDCGTPTSTPRQGGDLPPCNRFPSTGKGFGPRNRMVASCKLLWSASFHQRKWRRAGIPRGFRWRRSRRTRRGTGAEVDEHAVLAVAPGTRGEVVPHGQNRAQSAHDFFERPRLDLDLSVFSTLLETGQLFGFRYPVWFRLRWVRRNTVHLRRIKQAPQRR